MLMQRRSTSVERHFEKAAQTYQANANAQRAVAERLSALFPKLRNGSRVLELGCGTGILTEQIFRRYDEIEVTVVDKSHKLFDEMPEELRRKVQFVCADISDLPELGKFELVCSSSAIHWLRDFRSLAQKIELLLNSKANFVASVFLEGTLNEIHSLREELYPNKGRTARFLNLSSYLKSLSEAGFAIEFSSQFEIQSDFSSVQDMFGKLRAAGVNGITEDSYVPLSRGELRKLAAEYEARYSGPAGVYSTYVAGQWLARSRSHLKNGF